MYTLWTPSLAPTPAATYSPSELNAMPRHPVRSTAFENCAAHCGAPGGAEAGSCSGASPGGSSREPGLDWRGAGGGGGRKKGRRESGPETPRAHAPRRGASRARASAELPRPPPTRARRQRHAPRRPRAPPAARRRRTSWRPAAPASRAAAGSSCRGSLQAASCRGGLAPPTARAPRPGVSPGRPRGRWRSQTPRTGRGPGPQKRATRRG
jgi:hypothetical protein